MDEHAHSIDASDATLELDVLLDLAEHELRFLRTYFAERAEIAQTDSGAEFIETLDVSLLALTRIRFERLERPSDQGEHCALQNAIAVMKKDEP